jgi:hypothetical protein
MPYERAPSLAQVIQAAVAAGASDLRVACPGVIQRYDATTGLADVKPQVKSSHTNENGAREFLELPVVPNVPVVFPGAGGLRITFPITQGEHCLLIFCDRSIDEWIESGTDTEPNDARTHHLSDAIAIPGLRAKPEAWHGAEAGVVTIGADNSPADFVALAAKVDAQLAALKAAIVGWVPVPNDGGLALKTALAALFLGPPVWPATVASATVKVKG